MTFKWWQTYLLTCGVIGLIGGLLVALLLTLAVAGLVPGLTLYGLWRLVGLIGHHYQLW